MHIGAIADWVTAIATLALAAFAAFQLRAIRRTQEEQTENHRRWATLQACNSYDSNPILHEARVIFRKLRANQGQGIEDYEIKMAAISIFNFLDAIAIGVLQKLYVREIVKDHLENIVERHLEQLNGIQHTALEEFKKAFDKDFECLNKLRKFWREENDAEAKEYQPTSFVAD